MPVEFSRDRGRFLAVGWIFWAQTGRFRRFEAAVYTTWSPEYRNETPSIEALLFFVVFMTGHSLVTAENKRLGVS
jgi:hypothetical protein